MRETIALPLSDPLAVLAYLDRIVSWRDRRRHTVYAVLCDRDDRPLIHEAFRGMLADPPVEFCGRFAQRMAGIVDDRITDGRALFAVTRWGKPAPRAADQRWSWAMAAMFTAADVGSLGCYLVTPSGVAEVPAR
jgi:hypothetical protein